MFAATSLTNVLDYAYNVAMGRLLSAEGYGVLTALNAILQIVAVSMVVGSTVVARYTAEFVAREQPGQMGSFVREGLRKTLLWGGGAALALALASGPLARLLQIPSAMPVLVAAVALVPMVVKLVTVGTLQGQQKFTALGITHVSQAVLRLAMGVLLVYLGLDAVGALAAVPIGVAGNVLLGIVFLGALVWKPTDVAHRVSAPDLARYAGVTTIGVVSFAALTNMDALIVKHFYTPTQAGHYALALTLGKIVIFMPAAFAQVLFPKSAQRHAQQRDSSRLLWLSLAATLLPCVGLAVLYFALPDLILKFAFGVANPFGQPVLGLIALAMTGYALVNVWLNYFLSVERSGFVYALPVCLVVQFTALALFHASLAQVAIVVAVCSAGLLVFAGLWFYLSMSRPRIEEGYV
jgi:O-antigen/teichoic acid export membrane protein